MNEVFITYPHAHTVRQNFAYSMMNLLRLNDYIVTISPERCYPGDDLALGRNRSVARFLDDTQADWYWTVDTDMGFPPDTLSRLMNTGKVAIGALYRVQAEVGSDSQGGPQVVYTYPMAIGYDPVTGQTFPYKSMPQEGLMQVDLTGAGCLLLHRSILEKMRGKYGDNWFSIIVNPDDGHVGEDFSFCLRLKEMGFPLYVHAGIKTTHQKESWI